MSAWRRTAVIPLLLVILSLASPSEAARVLYFRLEGAGTASLYLAEEAGRAVLLDSGTAGPAGLAGVKIEGLNIFQWLEQKGYRHLVIQCSHPHADHMGGFREAVASASTFVSGAGSIARFSSVTFVDASVADRLSTRYEQAVTSARQTGVTLPKAEYISAEANNAYGRIFKGGGDLMMATWKYDASEKAGPHGRAVITVSTLRSKDAEKGIVEFTVVDTDDGEQALIDQWVAEIGVSRRIDAVILPHHGSNSNDISSLLRLNPKQVIVTANEDNRYLHPGLKNLLLAINKVGAENVHVTSDGDVELSPRGVRSNTSKESLLKLVRLRRTALSVVNAEASESTSKRRAARRANEEREEALMIEGFLGGHGKYPPEDPSPNTGGSGPRKSPPGGAPSAAEGGGSRGPSLSLEGGEAASGRSAGPSLWFRGREGAKSKMKKLRWSGVEEWRQNRESVPTVGGIVVGAPPASGTLKAKAPAVFTSDGGNWQLEVETTAGAVVFAEATNSELALAHALVVDDASALASCESSRLGEVSCGVLPAIGDTALAYDAQQLDATVPLGGAKLVLQSGTVLVVPRETVTVVWSDEPARISVDAGHLVVSSQTAPKSVLMRVRFIVERELTEKEAERADAELSKLLEIKDAAEILLGQPYDPAAVIDEFYRGKSRRDAKAEAGRFNAKVEALWQVSDSLQAIDRFARVRAVLYWLKQQGMLPLKLPPSLVARRIEVQSKFKFEPPVGLKIVLTR